MSSFSLEHCKKKRLDHALERLFLLKVIIDVQCREMRDLYLLLVVFSVGLPVSMGSRELSSLELNANMRED